MNDKKWHECACGESICAPDSEFGRVMLAEWRKVHVQHVGESYEADVEIGSHHD